MVCYQSVPGGVQVMKFYGDEKSTFWKESWHEIYVRKRTQKYRMDDKERYLGMVKPCFGSVVASTAYH